MKVSVMCLRYSFQSTLPRGERLDDRQPEGHVCAISIHAPARGATLSSTRGMSAWTFQSTLPRGERLEYAEAAEDLAEISIHAPARGATFIHRSVSSRILHFNPRSREGSDGRSMHQHHKEVNFNPRSREGSDRPSLLERIYSWEFQSTLPRGERHLLQNKPQSPRQ